MAGKKITVLLVTGALASGGAAAYFTDNHIKSEVQAYVERLDKQYEPVAIVVPNRNMRAGDVLSAQNLSIREVPGAFVHAEAIKANQSGLAIGHRLLHPVNDGEPLLQFHISDTRGEGFSSLIAKGKRAVTFAVDSVSSINGLLRPGDQIDLLLTLTDAKQDTTRALLSDVRIIATGRSVDELRLQGDQYQSITLLVDPVDAAKITHAKKVGKLTVVLRAPGDTTELGDRVITKNTLLGIKPVTRNIRPRRVVEIIRGGAG